MAWLKIDDQFFAHPKIVDLSKDAKLLHLASLTYAASQLTDGKLTKGAVRVAAAMVDVDRACVPELVKAGVWEETEDGYQIHDYLEYNPTREQALATKEARAEAGRKGGKQKASNLLEKRLANSQAKGVAKPKQNSTPSPSPSPEAKDKERNRVNTPVRALKRAGGADAAESLVLILCEESGFTLSDMTRKEHKDQRGYAAGILSEGFNEDEVRGCLKFLLSQPWRESKPDLLTVHRKIGQWKRDGRPKPGQSKAVHTQPPAKPFIPYDERDDWSA